MTTYASTETRYSTPPYPSLTEIQRTRFISLVSALYDSDCTPLCKWGTGKAAQDALERVQTTWGTQPLPILYEDYYDALTSAAWVKDFVLKGEM